MKMLHPDIDEYLIDTAAGSCGFTVHGIFHVWGNEFTAYGPAAWQAEYAGSACMLSISTPGPLRSLKP